MKKILLLGLSGTGKTGLGRILARELGFEFFDTEEIISGLIGRDSRLMLKKNEKIRLLSEEKLLAEKINKAGNSVIAYGGLFLFPEVINELSRDAYVCYLKSEPATILARLKKKNNLGLIQGIKDEASLEIFIAEHQKAHLGWIDEVIDMDLKDINDIAGDFLLKL